MVKQNTFDLVLMDVRMPEMDGLEALSQIKALDPRIFVVIMTAHSNLQDAVTAIREGAYDYIEKPVQPEKLAAIVKKALETQEMVTASPSRARSWTTTSTPNSSAPRRRCARSSTSSIAWPRSTPRC